MMLSTNPNAVDLLENKKENINETIVFLAITYISLLYSYIFKVNLKFWKTFQN